MLVLLCFMLMSLQNTGDICKDGPFCKAIQSEIRLFTPTYPPNDTENAVTGLSERRGFKH